MTSIDTTINGAPYTINCPTPPADWSPPRSDDAVPSDIEIRAPERAAPKHRLSASQFRDKLSETAETPQLLREPGPGDIDIDPPCVEPALEHIESTTIGTIVHKLCEFEPERTEWPAIIRRLVEDPEEVSEAAIDDMIRQTEAGLEAVRQLESESLVHSCHNKLGVTLDWEAATIVGDIDHLSVTDDGYVMTDFKTSTVDETTIADRTEHYSLQLLAYGGALMQADAQAERVTIAVVYTDAGTTRSRTLTRQDIESLLGWADEVLEEVAFVERR